VASEMGAEELSQRMYVLAELLRREFEGEYSEEFRQSLEVAETGRGRRLPVGRSQVGEGGAVKQGND